MIALHHPTTCALFAAAALTAFGRADCTTPVSPDPTATYFLVAEHPGSEVHFDSYILPIPNNNPEAIAHARDLIRGGAAAGAPIILAQIQAKSDGINRNFLAPDQPPWSWSIESFVSFGDMTIELIDSTPTYIEAHLEEWMDDTDGMIGFWTYTVVAELDPDEVAPPACLEDLNGDSVVNGQDLALLLGAWGLCVGCGELFDPPTCFADLNGDCQINGIDLAILLAAWG